MPQPNFVPVKPISSRRTQSIGVSGSMSRLTGLPLMVRAIIASLPFGLTLAGISGRSLAAARPVGQIAESGAQISPN